MPAAARPSPWDPFLSALAELTPHDIPEDFMADRDQGDQDRVLFDNYEE